jgi:hypothetical protein
MLVTVTVAQMAECCSSTPLGSPVSVVLCDMCCVEWPVNLWVGGGGRGKGGEQTALLGVQLPWLL